jgi:hypothetical protein
LQHDIVAFKDRFYVAEELLDSSLTRIKNSELHLEKYVTKVEVERQLESLREKVKNSKPVKVKGKCELSCRGHG